MWASIDFIEIVITKIRRMEISFYYILNFLFNIANSERYVVRDY